MMNKHEFMRRLEIELSNVPQDEARAAIEYYREYFAEAGEENEADVIRELGSPERIASQIRANVAMKNLEVQEPTVKKGISAIWLVILAIFAAPIALPLAIAALILVFALSVTAIAIVFSLSLAAVAVFISGIFAIGVGLFSITTNFAAAICSIGVGLATVGITLLLVILVIFVSRGMSKLIAMFSNGLLTKADKGGRENVQ